MNNVTDITDRYQTSSPHELANRIGIEVRYDSFDKQVRGIYCPDSNCSVLVLNRLSSSKIQKFILSYYIHVQLTQGGFNVHACTDIKQIALQSAFFAGDLLNENDEFRNQNITKYYIEGGVPPKMAEAMGKVWVKSGRCIMGKSSYPSTGTTHL